MRKYILFLIAGFFLQLGEAQIVNICGTDTVELGVDNYDNGVIQWQESLDAVTWISIQDATGPVLKFFPSETKYYRASVITSTCDPLYSEVSLVQLLPQAYAGSDREIGGNATKLLGNKLVAATGEWSISEGIGGSITEINNPYSEFTGNYGQEYKLIWTNTNACGQSKDTVFVVFEEILAKDNFIVVDETDEIFGDSLERTTGIYRIKFSDPTIVPSDTMMLVGMRRDISFLVKIESYGIENGVYVFTTSDGSLEDIIQSGPINVGDAVNEGVILDGTGKKSTFPTRETLKSLKGNKNQMVIYSGDFVDQDGNRKNVVPKSKGSNGLKLSVPDQEVFSSSDGALKVSIADAYVRFDPNFVCDFKIKWFQMKNIKIGLDNGEFEYNYKLLFEATAEKTLEKEATLFEYTNNIVFLVGPVPVVVSTSIAVNAEASLAASASLTVTEEKNYQKNFTALLAGDKLKDIKFVSFSSTKSTSSSDYLLQGRLDADFSVGPQISVELYHIIGPYFELPLTFHAGICANSEGNWNAEASLGIEGNMGVKAHLGKLKLFDIQHTLFKAELIEPLIMPYKINIISGNNQKGVQYELLTRPIDIKVTGSYGFAVPFVPVRFSLEDGNGSITNNVRYTDSRGMVSVNDWVLGNSTDVRLDISVLNCDNEDIDDFSPISAYAYASVNCANTDLAISLSKTETGVLPIVSGGKAPYTYSTDGSSFVSSLPEYNYSNEGRFMFYVKDLNGCNINRVVTVVQPDPCKSNPLFIDIYSAANTVTFTPISGNAPYLFSVDSTTNFSETDLYSNLSPGTHTVYLKDNNNCLALDSFLVENTETKGISAIYPRDKVLYLDPNTILFKWQSVTFAGNQSYDLYLKPEAGEYVNIAQNLSDETFAYAQSLTFGTQYVWKVVVKDQVGTEKENMEFSFRTMADPAILAVTPTLLLPANNALTDTTVTLSWQSQGGDFKYNVYVDGFLRFYSLSGDTAVISNLTPGMTYAWNVMIKSPTTIQTEVSNEWNFEIKSLLPTLISSPVGRVGQYEALAGGNVTDEGLAPVTERGICWSTSPSPTIENDTISAGTGAGLFTALITGLSPLTQYYYKAYATNSNGTVYGNEETFTTIIPVVDIDGNSYSTVTIGSQVWLQQNLKTTKYNNGSALEVVWYNDDAANKDIYGGLYTWTAIVSTENGGRNVCPVGFHVPSDSEFSTLATELGGMLTAGIKLKEAGSAHWILLSKPQTNESGFTALPGGYYMYNSFGSINRSAYIWTTSESFGEGIYRVLYDFSNSFNSTRIEPESKFSVRCLKD